MRDTNRLEPFYAELKNLHAKYFPDWRFLQLMANFYDYLAARNSIDPFYIEESDCIKLFKEFCGIEEENE